MDPIEVLPIELSLEILRNVKTCDLARAQEVSQMWSQVITANDWLWERHCWQHCLETYVKRDRAEGRTWKSTLSRNYGSRHMMHEWLRGRFSHGRSFCVGAGVGCRLDANDWGNILEAELVRPAVA